MTEEIEENIIIGLKRQFFKLGCTTIKGSSSNGSGKLWLGIMATGIANLSFACELSLKHLYYQKNSKTIPGHNLLQLYDKLSDAIRLQIRDSYFALCKSKLKNLDRKACFYIGERPKNLNQDISNFDSEITKYSLSFVIYRYYFEPQKTEVEGEYGGITKSYCFDYRFLYLFFLAINSLVKDDDTYEEYYNYYENLHFDVLKEQTFQ